MAGPNVRLQEPLKTEAAGYAAGLGISLNALVAVAVRDYLDSRRQLSVEGQAAPAVAAPSLRSQEQVPKVGANQPCPCGSGLKYKRCHGKL
jgi:hypothetical protein